MPLKTIQAKNIQDSCGKLKCDEKDDQKMILFSWGLGHWLGWLSLTEGSKQPLFSLTKKESLKTWLFFSLSKSSSVSSSAVTERERIASERCKSKWSWKTKYIKCYYCLVRLHIFLIYTSKYFTRKKCYSVHCMFLWTINKLLGNTLVISS